MISQVSRSESSSSIFCCLFLQPSGAFSLQWHLSLLGIVWLISGPPLRGASPCRLPEYQNSRCFRLILQAKRIMVKSSYGMLRNSKHSISSDAALLIDMLGSAYLVPLRYAAPIFSFQCLMLINSSVGDQSFQTIFDTGSSDLVGFVLRRPNLLLCFTPFSSGSSLRRV